MRTHVSLRLLRGGRVLGQGIALFVPLVASAKIDNPIGCDDIVACFDNVIEYALGLVGVLALAGIVYGGFLYITAMGNQDRIEQGKNAVFYSVIGIIVVGLAFAIIKFIFSALKGGGDVPGGPPPGGFIQ